ncbi:inhibitor of Bruton tyrosine kinase [Diorhabda sublineata]|uniref:inhibitor of Bruton tyrosine kinase n=1 Tax=Diorhabda sublineata TaxID=1163346 RepID=UPI0024E12029|nr:inhibitor of Bruton tyrosine kinase [Diorhabda sublineata]
MNTNNFERDCTTQCKSMVHGDIITDAISKRCVSDTDLCSFLNFICTRCESVIDSSGRTALHVAASCGRLNLVRWLISNRHSDINTKDKESGYTALHRSIFYGKIDITVELLKLGANASDIDLDYLTYLEHAMKDGLKPGDSTNFGEIYSWGSNNNNLLGHHQSKQSPDLLDAFHREYPGEYVKQICIAKFHSTIVTISGKALTCGHGQGGRLGLGNEKSVVSPQIVKFQGSQKGEIITCIQASISRDHSIFLCSDGNIYTCGLNTYQVLGLEPSPDKSTLPKQIKRLTREIQGVCASHYHSVAWGPNALYTWGLNAGQLGVKVNENYKNQFIVTPKLVTISNNVTITDVASSNGAIAVCTTNGDIYVMHEYLTRKIASRQLNFVQVSIVGGNLDPAMLNNELSKELNTELKVAVLTNTGNVLLWQGSDQQLCGCIYSINRAIVMKQICLNYNEILLVSKDGEAFKGFIKPRKKKVTGSIEKSQKNQKSAFHKFLEKEDCVVVSLQKINKIHRAISIISDLKGRDYSVIQAPPYKNYVFPHIESSEMKKNFETLLSETDEFDSIHDVVFKINDRNFPAHKYVVANSSGYLENLMENRETIILNNVNPDVFQQLLMYIYTGGCDLTECGELKNATLRKLCQSNEKNNKTKNPVRLLHEMAKKFECTHLQEVLSNLEMDKCIIYVKNNEIDKPEYRIRFDRLKYTKFYDVTVKCKDDQTLKAHKCLLAARLEYFNNMFMRWNGKATSEISIPFSRTTAEALLEYLYTDSLSKLNYLEVDHLFNILILADQLFVTRLKEQCELLLSDLLTLKNIIQITTFADIYNADKLKYCCMMFIIANIAPLLEVKAFNDLDDELLKELSDFYFDRKKEIQCRVITPYSTAVSDDFITSIAGDYPVSMTEEVEITQNKPVHKKRTRQRRHSERNVSVSDKDVSNDSIIQFPDEPVCLIENNYPSRLKSINVASKIVEKEEIHENYTSLNNISDRSSLSISFDDSMEFPELGSPNIIKGSIQKSESKIRIVKMSQKQRKRLFSESKVADTTTTTITPKNPWKILPDNNSPELTSDTKQINDIIYDEKKQKENLMKMTNKPLIFTQMEDKAIDELHKFYNVENSFDELISVERVHIGAVACPVWVPRQK